MAERNARYGGHSSGFNHARRNAIYDSDEESDGGHSRAHGGYSNDDELYRAMRDADALEARRENAARARGGGRSGRGGAHGGAYENPYHGVGAFTTDEEDSESEPAPRGVTRVHRRRGEGEEAHLGSRRGHGGGGRGGRIDPRDGSFHAPDACFSRDGTVLSRGGMMNHSRGGTMMHSHHHHGHDERAGQGFDDDDDSDEARMRARRRRRILDDSSEEEGDEDDARRIHAYHAAAGHGDRYGGPSRRY